MHTPSHPGAASGIWTRRQFLRASLLTAGGMAALHAATGFAADTSLVIIENATGMLAADPTLCVGCQRCENACTEFNEGKADPALARIRIGRQGRFTQEGLSTPGAQEYTADALNIQNICRQCPHPVPCATACPAGAIVAEDNTNTRMVDRTRCTGCRLCQSACPWGAMRFDDEDRRASKCFLCHGMPKCVAACPAGALRFVPWVDLTRRAGPRVPSVQAVSSRSSCYTCHPLKE